MILSLKSLNDVEDVQIYINGEMSEVRKHHKFIIIILKCKIFWYNKV